MVEYDGSGAPLPLGYVVANLKRVKLAGATTNVGLVTSVVQDGTGRIERLNMIRCCCSSIHGPNDANTAVVVAAFDTPTSPSLMTCFPSGLNLVHKRAPLHTCSFLYCMHSLP